MRTPSMVSDVSAIEVASTTLRWPFGAGAMARTCTAASSAPNSGAISIPASWIRSPRHRDRIRHLPLQRRVGLAAEIAGLDRKGAAFAGKDGRLAEQSCDPRAVERCRHHENPQILAQAHL